MSARIQRNRPVARNMVFDLDGVLLDFERAWALCASWTLARELRPLCDAYHLVDRYQLSKRECDRVWDVFHADWWDRVPVYEGAWEVITSLESAGATVWAVTNVDAMHHESRALSLQGLIPQARILCLGARGTPSERVEVLRSLRARAFLDDQTPNTNAAAEDGSVPVGSCASRRLYGLGSGSRAPDLPKGIRLLLSRRRDEKAIPRCGFHYRRCPGYHAGMPSVAGRPPAYRNTRAIPM